MLLETGRAGEALAEFEASAVRDPNRFRSHYGAALAAQRSGDTAKARAYFAKLEDLANKGDPRPEIETARLTMR
jgi:cytochrome c-type biogenesis protein CcmH/NrfG